jgi:hypothetical protein
MKPFFRMGAAALTAALLLAGSVNSQNQPDEGDEPQAPPPVLLEYDLHGLSRTGLEIARAPGMSRDQLAPDRLFGVTPDRETHQWSLRESGREACCWDEPAEALEALANFCSFDESWELRRLDENSHRCALVAPQVLHDRVRWALGALRNLASIRVNLRVHRLANTPDSTVLGARAAAELARGARLVGAASTGLGDPILLQQTGATTYVADYDANTAAGAGGHNPVTATLSTGEEFVAGAIVLNDGRLWVQGWHAVRKLESMRKLNSVAGEIELPTATYSYTPVSAIIENGGAAVMDAGPSGRFLLTATAGGTVPDTRLDCGNGRELRLINATGVLRGHAMGSRWLMTPNTQEAMHDTIFHQIHLDEEYVDGPYNDAAMVAQDRLEGLTWGQDLYVVGPLLGVKTHPTDPEDAELAASRQAFDRALAEVCRVRDTVGLRARAVRVPATAALGAGLLNGTPTATDLADLDAVAGRVVVTDRLLSNGIDQNMDLLDTRAMAMLHGYDSQTATEIMLHDPAVRSLLLGAQLRWVAREAADGAITLEMRAGVTVGSQQFDAVPVQLAGKPFVVERSRSNLVQARFGAELKPGQSLSHIVPGGGTGDELLVLVVTRVR